MRYADDTVVYIVTDDKNPQLAISLLYKNKNHYKEILNFIQDNLSDDLLKQMSILAFF